MYVMCIALHCTKVPKVRYLLYVLILHCHLAIRYAGYAAKLEGGIPGAEILMLGRSRAALLMAF